MGGGDDLEPVSFPSVTLREVMRREGGRDVESVGVEEKKARAC